MNDTAFCLFETALGTCALAWRETDDGTASVAGFQLPEATAQRTTARMARLTGAPAAGEPPPDIAAVIQRVRRHFDGDIQDFRDVPIDLGGAAPFARRVYEATRQIPPGQTRSYGEVARAAGRPGAARAVGQALGKNRIALIIPCHRILAADGKIGGFSAHGGLKTKARMLALEGTDEGSLFAAVTR